jgi:hypothetical protein
VSKSARDRANYRVSKRKKVFDLCQEVKEIEVLEQLSAEDSDAVRDLDGVWRPVSQLKYRQTQDEGE